MSEKGKMKKEIGRIMQNESLDYKQAYNEFIRREHEGWWESKTYEQQVKYVEQHPNSVHLVSKEPEKGKPDKQKPSRMGTPPVKESEAQRIEAIAEPLPGMSDPFQKPKV